MSTIIGLHENTPVKFDTLYVTVYTFKYERPNKSFVKGFIMKSEKRSDTSAKILTAAITCISSNGYANVSMRDIAEEAGVVLSQLNYYYKNKEGLFIEVIRSVEQEYLQKLEENMQVMDSTQEKILFLANYCQDVIQKDDYIYKLLLDFFSMAMWSSSLKQEFQIFFEEISDVIGKYIVNDHSISPQLASYTPQQITRFIFAATFGIAMQHIVDPKEEILDGLHILPLLLK